MLVVHHLENSRLSRALSLPEEPELRDDVVRHARHAETRIAPLLDSGRGLGKAAMIDGDRRRLLRSGRIVDCATRRHRFATCGLGDCKSQFCAPARAVERGDDRTFRSTGRA